jgi:hypothetical protein
LLFLIIVSFPQAIRAQPGKIIYLLALRWQNSGYSFIAGLSLFTARVMTTAEEPAMAAMMKAI